MCSLPRVHQYRKGGRAFHDASEGHKPRNALPYTCQKSPELPRPRDPLGLGPVQLKEKGPKAQGKAPTLGVDGPSQGTRGLWC